MIGSGNLGGNLARLFVQAGHEVALSNASGPDSLADTVRELGPNARAMSSAEAARWGDIVVMAVHFRVVEAFPPPETVASKIVVDATNAYNADFTLMDVGDETSSEVVARCLLGARIVKAFNTIYFEDLARQGDRNKPLEERRAVCLAGDDEEAKKTVAKLAEELGFAPVDTGSLREGGRSQQPGSAIYNRDLTASEVRTTLSALA
jgi:predicted dinucleotide-binding enzyme